MKNYIIPVVLIAFSACSSPVQKENNKTEQQPANEQPEAIRISSGSSIADSPYLTSDNGNRPVICWTEGEDENTILLYAVSQNDGVSFDEPIKVTPSKGLSAHHESMAKVAFKADGTVIAVFQHKDPTPENRFAGALFYVQSFDDGASWTKPKYLHTDTTKGTGRSFFDLARLPDGEIGAVWLDGRKHLDNGSTLYFAKTHEKDGFTTDKDITQTVCQCCRTDIYVDEQQNIHIAYRDIFNDSIRDMAHIVSTDTAITFSEPKCISPDNWVIHGCPHTGPAMVANENGLHFYWFTTGGGEGVYQNITTNNGTDFSERKLFNTSARHPQVTKLTNETVAIVWDETFKTEASQVNRIGLLLQNKEEKGASKYITPETKDASYPVVIGLKKGVLVAWTQKEGEKTQVYYRCVKKSASPLS